MTIDKSIEGALYSDTCMYTYGGLPTKPSEVALLQNWVPPTKVFVFW